MTRTQSSPLPWLLLAAACIVAAIILGSHAIEKHGAGVTLARSEFDRCDQLPGAEFFSEKRNTYAYLCFPDMIHMAVQILTDQRGNSNSREITTIPSEHVSKPINYTKTLFTRDGYVLKNSWGNLPEWFKLLIGK
jgi:hypothetical protein